MKSSNLANNIQYKEDKPHVELLLETAFTKEIRILLKDGQLMKEHSAPQPIVIEIFEGEIEFGVNGEKHNLIKGDLLTLDSHVPHDLLAKADSIVRLSLSKGDGVNRVADVASSK